MADVSSEFIYTRSPERILQGPGLDEHGALVEDPKQILEQHFLDSSLEEELVRSHLDLMMALTTEMPRRNRLIAFVQQFVRDKAEMTFNPRLENNTIVNYDGVIVCMTFDDRTATTSGNAFREHELDPSTILVAFNTYDPQDEDFPINEYYPSCLVDRGYDEGFMPDPVTRHR